jgi:HNH endonuclease
MIRGAAFGASCHERRNTGSSAVNHPPPEKQIEFLTNLQRLFNEGSFVATYKFALLSALADLCVENGSDTDAELDIPTRQIAEKFVKYYWRQSRPFLPKGRTGAAMILRQNTGRQAGVLRLLRELSEDGTNSLNWLQGNHRLWNKLITEVDRIVRQMPLWKLQTVGKSTLEFLYPNRMRGNSIRLKPGVMFCFRVFHIFITDMIRGAWVRYVRRFNQEQLADPADLDEFLFVSERVSLAAYVPILREVQSARCFYCKREIRPTTDHVDHFIPWAVYPVNLGHNFVLADSACNNSKSDYLAAEEHLKKWAYRNSELGAHLSAAFDRAGIIHDVKASTTIADWAYQCAFAAGAETFRSSGVFERLSANWRDALRR